MGEVSGITKLPSTANVTAAAVKIYFDIIVDSQVSDPKVKKFIKDIGGVTSKLIDIVIASIESGGVINRQEAIKLCIGLLNDKIKFFDVQLVQCATSLVDLALAVEAAWANQRSPYMMILRAMPGAGTNGYALITAYYVVGLLAAALSSVDSCLLPKQAMLMRANIRISDHFDRALTA